MGSTLYRFAEGVGTELASGVNLSTSRDNFPGGSITSYQDGVAYLSNESGAFGGLFYATDTVRQLAFIAEQRGFNQAFAPREVNDTSCCLPNLKSFLPNLHLPCKTSKWCASLQ